MLRRLLCIEPSVALQEILKELLSEGGWEVECCRDIDAVQINLAPVDVVITAVTLPSGNFQNVLQYFRGDGGRPTPPVLLLAADDELSQGAAALAQGVTEVFSKNDLGALRSYFDSLAGKYEKKLGGGRVLVLDDDVVIGLYLQQLLAEFGLAVDRKSDMDEALAAVSATTYDMVIVDIVLGVGQSGNHFIRLFRQTSTHSRAIPVIAISGYTDDVRRLDALRAGADAYLTKPLNEAEFMLTVRRLLVDTLADLPDPGAVERLVEQRYDLSRRESSICALAVAGHPDKRIAETLGISFWTVRTHLASIFRKCGVNNRIDLARLLSGRSLRPGAGPGNNRVPMSEYGLSQYLLDGFHYGVMVTDKNHRILYVNQAFTRISGYMVEDVIGRTPSLLHSGKHNADFYADMLRLLTEEGNWSGEIWDRHKNGSLFLAWLDMRRLPPGAPKGARYVAVMSDVTERQLELDRVRHYALHDALTGLGNRTLLESRWSYEMARARRTGSKLGVLFIDLDRFKAINDSLGHENGDRLLVIVAARIRGGFRNNDTVVRYGGDEFVVLVPDLSDRDAAGYLAEKTLESVCAPFNLEEAEFNIGASVGIALFPEHGHDLESLINRADAAMYRAKEAGGNRFRFFGQELGGRGCSPEALELAFSRGVLQLCFQPRLDVNSLQLVGAGTLLCSGELGIVEAPPSMWTSLGERSSRAVDLFDWMLQEACSTLRRAHEAGFDSCPVALKVPTAQLMRRTFLNEVATALTRNGVLASQLMLEVSEASWLREPVRVREVLQQLKEMGIALVLDGFGVGQSRLELVKELPLDFLKFDRELISAAPNDRYSASVVSSLVHLAGGLGIKTVAEGVDHSSQFELIKRYGCHHAQGLLFGKPFPEAELLACLESSRTFPSPLDAADTLH